MIANLSLSASGPTSVAYVTKNDYSSTCMQEQTGNIKSPTLTSRKEIIDQLMSHLRLRCTIQLNVCW